ncbi:MAG: acyltransferase [Flavobacterium sp.]|uniref:acyltransferase family protein n=1 Tax=Flavobacterium sp. TaxID=239 RepID=UPI001B1046E6|nr:acyltransferase [Flavobacterium sp.]MBO9584155.1 acyltransferase [Flavobacterium sp.]
MADIEYRRFSELDGLRGIAALMVFFSHFIGFYYETEKVSYIQNSWIRIFWDGSAAVTLFFVLSGFVLTLSVLKSKRTYFEYLIKRIFRIYPAYYFSIVFCALLLLFYNHNNLKGLSVWAQSFWIDHIGFLDVLKHFALVLPFNTRLINPVIWSLAIEIKMSLFIPLILYFFKGKRSVLFIFFITLFIYSLSICSDKFYYLPEFFLGLVTYTKIKEISTYLSAVNNMCIYILLVISILFFGNRYICPIIPLYSEALSVHFSGLGSALLIVLTINSDLLKKIFNLKAVQFLGKISYSFYLLHLPVLLICCSLLYPYLNSLLLCGICALVISFFLSYLSYNYIELKMISEGNKFANILSKK